MNAARLEAFSMTFAEVIDVVGSSRSWTDGSGPWTRRFLEEADLAVAGHWSRATVTRNSLLSAALPPHAGEPCRGDRMVLVPEPGQTVQTASAFLKTHAARYARENPSCWGRITQAMDEEFSTVILSSVPISVAGHDPAAVAGPFVLDGLHRLLGWSLAGRLNSEDTIPIILCGPHDDGSSLQN